MLMHRVGVGMMLCSEWCRVWEQQLLEWHGAKQRARRVLRSSQPKGLATKWRSDMLCGEWCECRGRRLRTYHRSREQLRR